MSFLSQLSTKLLSRKLWVTVLTLVAVMLGANEADGVDPIKVSNVVTVAIGGLYVLIQGLVDRAQAKAQAAVAASPALVQEVISQLKRHHYFGLDKTTPRPSGARSGIAMLAVMALASPLASGCMHNERPACSERVLVDINAAYLKDIVAACAGRPLTECEQAEAIDIAYAERVKEWVECR